MCGKKNTFESLSFFFLICVKIFLRALVELWNVCFHLSNQM